jgi:fatty-acid desaturase
MHYAPSSDVVNGRVVWSPVKSLWWLVATTVAIVGGAATISWSALALFLSVTAAVLLFGHSLGSHRKLIHDSFQCPKWLEYALVYAGVQVGLSGPLGLARQHDLRDYAQRQQDCHDYLRHGRAFWADGWWQLHCELRLDNPPSDALPAALSQDRFYQFLERTWMLQQIPPAILLYCWGGWAFVIWGVFARISAGVTGHWLIGHFAHNHGSLHNQVNGAAVQGRNVKFASLLTMGESWHNNHHAYPGSARLGLYPGEWDPGWWTLVLLRKLGLAWNFRLPDGCAHRPQLQALDDQHWIKPATPQAVSTIVKAVLTTARTTLGQSQRLQLQGPCVIISDRSLHWLAGSQVTLQRVPGLARLQLAGSRHPVQGLPALLLAIGSRNLASALVATVLLPLGVVTEVFRSRLCAANSINQDKDNK